MKLSEVVLEVVDRSFVFENAYVMNSYRSVIYKLLYKLADLTTPAYSSRHLG